MHKYFLQAVSVLLVFGHSVALADREPFRIGALIVLTGQYSMQGSAFREGLELAIDEINSQGGIEGRTIELRAEDTANLPTQALTAARKLIAIDHVDAAITTSYPELATGAVEMQKAKIPVVHLWDSSPDIEGMGDYIFGIGPWTPSSGEVSAAFARKELGAKTAIVIHINDPWSELVAKYFVDQFKQLGGEVVQEFSHNPQDQDFRATFTKIRKIAPDVIYSPITDNIVPFYSQLRQLGLKMPVISSDVIADEHVKQAPAVFEGIYQSQMRDPAGSEMEKLSAAYKRKHGRAPGLPWFVATAYDSVMIIKSCLEKGTERGTAMRDCIGSTNGLQGASQVVRFNSGGSSPQIESIFKIKNGQFEIAWQQ